MIDKLPKCLHTCLNCGHAVIYEEYSDTSRSIIFGGCWKIEGIKKPVDREKCQKFKESPERVKRSFWKKWEGHIYIDYKENPFRYEQEERINYVAFEPADTLLPAEHGKPAGEHEEISGEDEQTQDPELFVAEHGGFPEEHKDPVEPGETAAKPEESPQDNNVIAAEHEESPAEHEEIIKEHKEINRKNVTRVTKTNGQKNTPTRSLILQALANNISRLKDIASFADVDPSTAHYHLRNLIREERVAKVSWGRYLFSDDQPVNNNGKFLKSNGRTFEKFLKNFSQSCRESAESVTLNPIEKNILMDILSKDNRYEHFSERELARKSNVSRYSVRKYTQNLEKKQLIKIKREGKQLVFVPTEMAINGLRAFFQSFETGSKIDSSSLKIQPIYQPVENSKIQPITEKSNGPQSEESLNVAAETPGTYTPSENVLETFDDYIAWQQKNAHRLIIQFKLLRCNHPRLKRTGWIFGQKSIHKHFTEAYIFKSKDPTGEFINVLPKKPFIFTSPFEFEDKIIDFVSEVVERLKEYGMALDLSEPAEIKLEHAALEDNVFARKVIRKGLLYFKSKVVTVDSTGELITYAIAIDKSKKLHLEVEGKEAHHLIENCEEFIDDIATKRIDPKLLRELPEELTKIKKGIEENKEKQTTFDENLKLFSDTIDFYSENIKTHINAMTSLTASVNQLTEATEKIEKAAEAVEKTAEALIEVIELLKGTLEKNTTKKFFSRLFGGIT
ncbi:MAG: hypothetical protein AYK18_13475 [Theionarchaea archaeon DG-70]|nr:MAG: hypothetical protein AYK18_13475 [Theionarchaea archaeon DG-70]